MGLRRKTKVLVLAIVLGVVIVSYGGISAILSRFATREVNKLLNTLPNVEASCGSIHISVLRGSATVRDLRFSYHGEPAAAGKTAPGTDIYVERIELERLYYSMLLGDEIIVHSFNVIRPRVELWLDEEHPELSFPKIEKDTTLPPMEFPFLRAELLNLNLEEALLALHSISSGLDVVADDCSFEAHNLAYADSAFTFNDSVYSFSLTSVGVCLPDGKTRIKTNHVAFQNKGKLTIGVTRMTYCAAKKQTPDVPGSDIRIGRIEIGPVSHEMLFQRQVLIQAFSVIHPQVELWMDEEHPELSFPQMKIDPSMQLELPIERAEMRKLDIRNASMKLHSTRTQLDVAVDSCSFHMRRLAYDSLFHCDTVLNYALGNASVRFPDGAMQLDTRGIIRVDKDGLTIGNTHMYTTKPNPKGTVPGSDIRVESVHIDPISIAKLMNKEALLNSVSINQPRVEIWLDDEQPELSFPSFRRKPKDKPFQFPLDLATLQHLYVNNASMALHGVHNRLDVGVNDCSLAVHDIMYADDECFSYNDSVYRFLLQSASILTPDGLMRIEVNGIEHHDQGPLRIGKTHIGNVMARKELGDYLKEPSTWMNMYIDSVITSPFNPFRKAMAKDWSIEHVSAMVSEMDVFRDERFKYKRPSPMPQEALMSIPVIFRIDRADAHVRHMNVDLANTDINNGHLELNRLGATLTNITNRRGQVMRVKGGGPIGKGKAEAKFTMTMNDAQDFSMDLRATGFNVNLLNSFIRPLVGISVDIPVDTVETRYTGDRVKATGTFKMLYHGLEIEAHKEDDVPYKIVTQNANTITHIGNNWLPKSNPKKPGEAPRIYNVQYKRDEWKLVALYMFGPLIDGAVKTFLPGLFLSERVKQPKAAKETKPAKEPQTLKKSNTK